MKNVDCRVCHIPTFERNTPTRTEWYWETAGDVDRGVVTDPDINRPVYNPKKGTFARASTVIPTLRYFDRKWNRFIVEANDNFTDPPAVLGEPTADYNTPEAKICPFKKMIGNQPADASNNTGQSYSGAIQFAPTVMYLTMNHGVGPKEQAYGMDGACGDCHGDSRIDWTELGWTEHPILPPTPARPYPPKKGTRFCTRGHLNGASNTLIPA